MNELLQDYRISIKAFCVERFTKYNIVIGNTSYGYCSLPVD